MPSLYFSFQLLTTVVVSSCPQGKFLVCFRFSKEHWCSWSPKNSKFNYGLVNANLSSIWYIIYIIYGMYCTYTYNTYPIIPYRKMWYHFHCAQDLSSSLWTTLGEALPPLGGNQVCTTWGSCWDGGDGHAAILWQPWLASWHLGGWEHGFRAGLRTGKL